MGWTVPPGTPDVLLHYSEDPGIEGFEPHVPRTNLGVAPAVWAIDPEHAPLYWFPRACPRVAVWANDAEQRRRLHQRFGTSCERLQATTPECVDAMLSCELYEYRLDPDSFVPWPEAEGQWIARERVVPRSVQPVGDLIERHASAGIELRFADDLDGLRALVVTSGLPFSIVRFRPGSEMRAPGARDE